MQSFKSIFESVGKPGADEHPPIVPSRAIVVIAHGKPHVLYHHGNDITYWLDKGDGACGDARDLIDDAAGDGVYAWSGRVHDSKHETDCGTEYDVDLITKEFRPITEEEWDAFIADDYIWDDAELRACEEWHKAHPEYMR